MGLADSVETLGVDLRTRTKVGEKEKARRRKCDVKVAIAKQNHVVKKNYKKLEVRKLLRMGLVPARVWRGQALGIPPTERLKLRRQMASVAGKKSSTSLSLFSRGEQLRSRGGDLCCGRPLLGQKECGQNGGENSKRKPASSR